MKERELSKRTELRKKKPTALFSFPSSSKGQVARWRSFQAASFCCSGIWTFTSSFKICLMLTLYPCHVWVRNFWFGRVQWVEHRGLVVCSLKLLFFDVFFWHVGHGRVWFWLGVDYISSLDCILVARSYLWKEKAFIWHGPFPFWICFVSLDVGVLFWFYCCKCHPFFCCIST